MSNRLLTAVLADRTLQAGDRMVLVILADMANDDGECWPSMRGIGERAGMTARGARKVIRRLESAGFVQSKLSAGGRGANRYRIVETQLQPATPEQRPAPTPEHSSAQVGTTFRAPRNPRSGHPGTPVPPNPNRTLMEPKRETRARDSGETPVSEPAATSAAVLACRALREIGLAGVNPSDARLGELIGQGVTPEVLVDVATEITQKRGAAPSFAYLHGTVVGRMRDAATLPEAPKAKNKRQAIEAQFPGWRNDGRKTDALGKAIGYYPPPQSISTYQAYRQEIDKRLADMERATA